MTIERRCKEEWKGICVHYASLLFSSLPFLASLLSLTYEFYSELECVFQVLVLADFILLTKQGERKRGGRGQRWKQGRGEKKGGGRGQRQKEGNERGRLESRDGKRRKDEQKEREDVCISKTRKKDTFNNQRIKQQ
jgi:hypothetical protein